jgi:hypothetical protein
LTAPSGGSFVWVDGRPALLSADNPPSLGAAESSNFRRMSFVIWDTGEILKVTKKVYLM